MAQLGVKTCMVLIGAMMMIMPWEAAAAQSPSSSCSSVLLTLSPCLDYITGNTTKPSTDCCTQLASVVRSTPLCLCQLLNGSASSLGLSINQTLALNLPGACRVQTPPISQCNAASPGASAEPPTGLSTGSGSNTAPPAETGSSPGSSNEMTFSILFMLVFFASYASTIITG